MLYSAGTAKCPIQHTIKTQRLIASNKMLGCECSLLKKFLWVHYDHDFSIPSTKNKLNIECLA